MKNDPAAFQWASQELQSDRELWLQALASKKRPYKTTINHLISMKKHYKNLYNPIYALVSSFNTPPPMVWSPPDLARGQGPGLRLGKTTSQPSSLYLLHVA